MITSGKSDHTGKTTWFLYGFWPRVLAFLRMILSEQNAVVLLKEINLRLKLHLSLSADLQEERWWEETAISMFHFCLTQRNCAWELVSQLNPGKDLEDLKQSMWPKQTRFWKLRSSMQSPLWPFQSCTSSVLRNWTCRMHYFIYLLVFCKKPLQKKFKTTSFESYLPPPKGLVREDAVLFGHQRVDGLIEAFSKPRVPFLLCYALPTGTQPFGEKAVWKLKRVLEDIERWVPERVTKQEHRKGNATKQESKVPDFSSFDWRHVTVTISWWAT